MQTRLSTFLLVLAGALALASCSTGPKTRTDYDHKADFSAYRTFGFPEQTGTDRGGYSTLVTGHFKEATRRNMEARGYRFTDQNPDLLVNFFANVKDRTSVESSPSVYGGYGYYGYRYGLYTAWPLYQPRDVQTVHYKYGTANIDIADAKKKQLVWEGVAEGELSSKALEDPQNTIDTVVDKLFEKFPGRAGNIM